MPGISPADLEKMHKENASLRSKIAAEEQRVADHEAKVAMDYEASQLLVENARLAAELAAAEARTKRAMGGDGTEAIFANQDDRLAAAQAALQSPAGVPVDTNASVPTTPATPPTQNGGNE